MPLFSIRKGHFSLCMSFGKWLKGRKLIMNSCTDLEDTVLMEMVELCDPPYTNRGGNLPFA